MKAIMKLLFGIFVLFEIFYLFVNLSPYILPFSIWQPLYYMIEPRFHLEAYQIPNLAAIIVFILAYKLKCIVKTVFRIALLVCIVQIILFFMHISTI